MMKYKSTVTSKQMFLIDGRKKVYIYPGDGEMTEEEAHAVAKTPWGKRLIETKLLEFEKPIEVKEEEIHHGMTVERGKHNRRRKPSEEPKPSEGSDDSGSEDIPDFGNGNNTGNAL